MQIEVTYIISIINALLAVAVFYFARKKDTHEESFRSGELISELKTVRRDISEMKMDVQAMRKEWRDDHDALQGLIREMGAVWKIIDKLKEGEQNGKNKD